MNQGTNRVWLIFTLIGLLGLGIFPYSSSYAHYVLQEPQASDWQYRAEGVKLYEEALRLFQAGRIRPAIDKLFQALPLLRNAHDLRGTATVLNALGTAHSDLGEPEKGLPYLTDALKIRSDNYDFAAAAITRLAIGSAYADMGQPQQALDNYNQARRTFKDREDAKHEAKALFMIARVYDDLSEKKQALVYCYDALRRIQDSDPSQIIQLYMLIGTLFADLGRFDDSIQNLEKARAVLDDPKTEKSQEGLALVQGLTGLTYARAGNMQKALEFLTQARGTYHQLSDPGGEASALNHIGSLQETLGQKEDALQTYSLALQLSVMEITKEFLPILGTI